MVRDLFVFSRYCGLAYIDVIDLDMDQNAIGIDNEKMDIHNPRQK